MEILNDRKYSPKHTWAKLDGEYAYIGVTDFAQDQLGEVLYVDVPDVEDELTKDVDFGVIESSKLLLNYSHLYLVKLLKQMMKN